MPTITLHFAIELRFSAPGQNNSLGLFPRFSPCGGLPGNFARLSIRETLLLDGLRLQSLLGKNFTSLEDTDSNLLAVDLPEYKQGVSGHYVVVIGLGTPKVDEVVIFDTGSSTTWVQCSYCTQCNPQLGTIFNPSSSSTYSTATCDGSVCALPDKNIIGCSSRRMCMYEVVYGKGYTYGDLGQDVLTLSPTLRVTGFAFGCGMNQSDDNFGAAGILGLGRKPLSIVSQTLSFFHGVFSYCLPASSQTSGHLTLGGLEPVSYLYVPMLTIPGRSHYYLNLVGISVGGTRLAIPETDFSTTAGTIIDSGTTLTRIPQSAYIALREATTAAMSQYGYAAYQTTETDLLCYNFTGLSEITVPAIALYISGTAVELSGNGVFWDVADGSHCLAFKVNENPTLLPNIIGYVNQRQLEVVYDIPNSRIGFANGTCV